VRGALQVEQSIAFIKSQLSFHTVQGAGDDKALYM